ncbi:MAG: precorrin-2 C(20)-methyltransferase [Clostridiales bacterium]|jgi:precorrin-2/cobalt-factor-2 C20-methyltransferase|nr:precorrin-2 C(20)-methyltransferase [Clostridiales bacterium]
MFYGVGVGPGDPALLTLRAVEVLRQCGVIAAPDTSGRENTALTIVAAYLEGKRVVKCRTPMTRDPSALKRAWEDAANEICTFLEQGEDVCYITLGDPAVYSTLMYVHALVAARGFETEIVPGVSSFCAAAAALKTSLCEGGTPLHIIPASYDGLEDALNLPGVKVLMKSGTKTGAILDALEQRGLLARSKMVSRCGMPGEKLHHDLRELDRSEGYFSVIIVGESE